MSAIDDFVPYRYIERDVKALPLTIANQKAIVNILVEDVNKYELGYLLIEYAAGARVPTITFRYKDDTVDRILQEGMYLVVINVTGEKRVMTAEEFVAAYEEATEEPVEPEVPEDNAIVGEAIVGEATL